MVVAPFLIAAEGDYDEERLLLGTLVHVVGIVAFVCSLGRPPAMLPARVFSGLAWLSVPLMALLLIFRL